MTHTTAKTPIDKANAALWTIQGLLALLFLFAGGMKLVMPIEMLTAQSPLPGGFLRFIGAAELLGGLGLILPQLLRIQPWLTPLAAAGLVVIMIGATVTTALTVGITPAAVPLVVGLLTALVVHGRRSLMTGVSRGPVRDVSVVTGFSRRAKSA